jgi:branched-subunit amino acid transport protein
MKNALPLIIGMMTVTYLPRLLPMLVLSDRPLPPLLRRFFLYIPYTALGALIIRGIIESPSDRLISTLAGVIVAAAVSWLRGGLVPSVAAAILAVFFLLS